MNESELEISIGSFEKFINNQIAHVDERMEDLLSTYVELFHSDTSYDVFKNFKPKPYQISSEEFKKEDYFLISLLTLIILSITTLIIIFGPQGPVHI